MDLIDHNHPLFVGDPEHMGDRASNFTIQNSDLFLSVGCRLAIGLVSYQYENFAQYAKKIVVDIDEEELSKSHQLFLISQSRQMQKSFS